MALKILMAKIYVRWFSCEEERGNNFTSIAGAVPLISAFRDKSMRMSYEETNESSNDADILSLQNRKSCAKNESGCSSECNDDNMIEKKKYLQQRSKKVGLCGSYGTKW